jgi:molybdenum cofactor cytidylyltransferase
MKFTSAILTAAGKSERMGTLKPLLPWEGVTLLEYQIGCLVDCGVSEVIVVLGYKAEALIPYVHGVKVRYIVNPLYQSGKTTSIKTALLQMNLKTEAIILIAVDQPRTINIISTIINAHFKNNALITSPRFQHRGGHPLIFSSSLKKELTCICEDSKGIRRIMQSHSDKITWVDINDPIIRLDLNTPEAYEEGKKIWLINNNIKNEEVKPCMKILELL